MSEINITPFTDVLLVLLIVFMICAAFTTPPGFQKSSPRGAPQSFAGLPPAITVRIETANRIWIDGRRFAVTQIYPAIAQVVRAHRRENTSTRVLLFTNGDTRYDLIIKILDAARQAGDDDVSFVVK
jgi:biopolymer transport protein TolR